MDWRFNPGMNFNMEEMKPILLAETEAKGRVYNWR
jgi:hypothetical protein